MLYDMLFKPLFKLSYEEKGLGTSWGVTWNFAGCAQCSLCRCCLIPAESSTLVCSMPKGPQRRWELEVLGQRLTLPATTRAATCAARAAGVSQSSRLSLSRMFVMAPQWIKWHEWHHQIFVPRKLCARKFRHLVHPMPISKISGGQRSHF
jgi:hypothetical protein